MDVITQTSNEKIKELKKLQQKKYRHANGKYLIETWHLIEEAKKYNYLELIITSDFFYSDDKVKVLYVEPHIIKSLSLLKTPSPYLGLARFFDQKIDYNSDLIVLENIQNPGNLGTILRNALAFGIKDIILSDNCVDLYNEKVIQASQGAIFQLNIIKSEIKDCLQKLKENNYFLIGSSLKNASVLTIDNAYQHNNQKIALFFGNEGQGLLDDTINQMDLNYYIEINNIDSLNVMSASAIFLYLLRQKR